MNQQEILKGKLDTSTKDNEITKLCYRCEQIISEKGEALVMKTCACTI